MAEVKVTSELIVIAAVYADQIIAQANRETPILTSGRIRVMPGAGKGLQFVVSGDGAAAESIAETDDVSNFASDPQQDVTIPWATIVSAFSVTDKARLAAIGANPMSNAALSSQKVMEAASAVLKLANQQFYTGTGANQVVGLVDAIGDDANTYAGIDRTIPANAYWQPYVVDPGVPTPLTLALIQGDLAAIKVKSGMRPDLALVSPATYQKVKGVFTAVSSYNFSVSPPAAAGMPAMLSTEAGINVDGCIFLEDTWAPDGDIFYLNTSYVWMEHLVPDGAYTDGLPADLLPLVQARVLPLGMHIKSLAGAGLYNRHVVASYPQLAVRRPNACGTRYNVAV